MKFNTTKIAVALALTLGATAAHAVAVNNGDVLSINPSVRGGPYNFIQATGGSWFGMDGDGNGVVSASERVDLATGANGIVIGATTTAVPGSYHTGLPTGSEPMGPIVASWSFFNSTGTNFNTVGITGSTTAGLNFSGWNVAWNAVSAINMGAGAWGTGFTNGVANLTWSGVYGTPYSLDYHATVPVGDPSGFQNVKYALHFEGNVTAAAVPEASTYGMMLAGLGLVGGMVARRRKGI
jgi:hypothetical protein